MLGLGDCEIQQRTALRMRPSLVLYAHPTFARTKHFHRQLALALTLKRHTVLSGELAHAVGPSRDVAQIVVAKGSRDCNMCLEDADNLVRCLFEGGFGV